MDELDEAALHDGGDLPAAPARGDALHTPWADLILAVVGLRVVITMIGVMAAIAAPHVTTKTGPVALLLDPWRRFDALWFTQIAAHGFVDPLSTAYMPLYPFLIRVVSFLTGGHYLTAALLVSNVSMAIAAGLIWRWVAELFGPTVAWRTVLLLLVYPDAFFLLGAYSEALFLALSAGSLLAVQHRRPVVAGALASLAALTRLQGLVLIVPILLALRNRRTGRAVAAHLLGAALPVAAFAVYERVLTSVLGRGAVLDTYRDGWHIALQAPWQTIQRYITVIRSPHWHLFTSADYNYILLWDLLIALASLAVLLLLARRLGMDLTIFGLAGWCFMMTRWYSTGRYVMAILPFFLALALWAESRSKLRWLATGSAVLLIFYTMEFAQNSWVD